MRFFIVFLCSLLGFNLVSEENSKTPGNNAVMTMQEYRNYHMRLTPYDDNQKFKAVLGNANGEIISSFDNCEKSHEENWQVMCEQEGETLVVFFEIHYVAVWTKGEQMQILDAEPQSDWSELFFTQTTLHEMKIERNHINGNDNYSIGISGLDFDIEQYKNCTARFENGENQCQDFYLECYNSGEKPSQVKVEAKAQPGCQNYAMNAEWISPANVRDPVYFRADECILCGRENIVSAFKKAVYIRMRSIVDAAMNALSH